MLPGWSWHFRNRSNDAFRRTLLGGRVVMTLGYKVSLEVSNGWSPACPVKGDGCQKPTFVARRPWAANSDLLLLRILSKPQVMGILCKSWRSFRDLVQALTQLPGQPLLVDNHGIQ